MERTVLITGSSSGIGRATAAGFLDEGWTVYATARNPEDVSELAERDGCRAAELDVTVDHEVDRVVDRMLEETGRIDCLVNNAGYGQYGPVEDVSVDTMRRQFEVNVYGPQRLMRAVLPHMRRREDGTIVNVSSAGGRIAFPGGGAYCGSKFALEAVSDSLRNEVRQYGIDVVLIEPGPAQTGFVDRVDDEFERLDRSGAYEEFYEDLGDATLLASEGVLTVTAEEVAAEIVNAASATKPPTRVPVGIIAKAAELGRFVPDWALDRFWTLADRIT